MFKFNFSETELGLEDSSNGPEPFTTNTTVHPQQDVGHGSANDGLPTKTEKSEEQLHYMALSGVQELSIEELAKHLPHVISYSPLVIPLTGEPDHDGLFGRTSVRESAQRNSESESGEITATRIVRGQSESVTLVRRDLFDVRYQLMAQDDDDDMGESAKEGTEAEACGTSAATLSSYIDNPSDLVAGVYEGGLKTWECSLDLVDCLASLEAACATNNRSNCRIPWARGKNIIEIGCGTAVPTLYLLQSLFFQPASHSGEEPPLTQITLQDYNDSVIRLVTFPNVLLTWYISSQAESYRSSQPNEDEDESTEASSSGGSIHITPALLFAFKSSLEQLRISLRFLVGSWQAMVDDPHLIEVPCDLILSSETIYQTSSLSSLVRLLQLSMANASEKDIESCIGKLELGGANHCGKQVARNEGTEVPLCLVAAKVLYFGVGGGVSDFECTVKGHGGQTMPVLQRKTGVGRMVLRVVWA